MSLWNTNRFLKRAKKNGCFESAGETRSTATHCVEDEDGAQLNEAVQGHVSEETEGGDQRTPALSAQTRRKTVHSCSRHCSANMTGLGGFPISIFALHSLRKHFKCSLLPHLISSGTQLMFSDLEVKGEATEASASDRDTPTSAALRAPQSLAPSPHMPTR